MSYLRTRPELLSRFRAGERAAMTEVYHAYVPRLDLLVRSAFKVRTADDHADTIQEVIVHAFRREARLAYGGERDYWSYLAVIARNVFISRRRRQGREVVVSSRDSSPAEDLLSQLTEPEPQAEAEHGWLEPRSLEITREYIASLPEPLRAVHAARYVQALSQREAAEQLGLSRSKLCKLEDRLRQELLDLLNRAGIRSSDVPHGTPTQGASHG